MVGKERAEELSHDRCCYFSFAIRQCVELPNPILAEQSPSNHLVNTTRIEWSKGRVPCGRTDRVGLTHAPSLLLLAHAFWPTKEVISRISFCRAHHPPCHCNPCLPMVVDEITAWNETTETWN